MYYHGMRHYLPYTLAPFSTNVLQIINPIPAQQQPGIVCVNSVSVLIRRRTEVEQVLRADQECGLRPTAGTSSHNHHLSLDIEELASVQSFHRVEVLHCIIFCHRRK